MLTQLQLEGPELEPLLVRVRSELGSTARIVQAEKVRLGGVAGFFARERYELTVEVDDEQPRAAATAPPPRGARDLPTPSAVAGSAVPAAPVALSVQHSRPAELERVPRAHSDHMAPEHLGTEPVASQHVRTDLAGRAPHAPAVSPVPAAVPFAAVTGLGGPVDRPSEAYAAIASLSAGAPRGAHDAVVATLAAVTGSTPADLVPVQTPPGRADVTAPAAFPQDGFSAHPAFPALADQVPPASPAAPAPSAAAPLSLLDLADQVSDEEHAAVVSTESPSFASLLSQLGSSLGAEAPVPAAVATTAVEQVASCPMTTLEHAPLAPPIATTAAASASSSPVPQQRTPAAADAAAVSSAQVVAAPGPHAGAGESRPDMTGAELARLGLPPHLRPQSSGEQLHTALRAALTRLPSAPPATNRAGGVLAVVGPLALALRVAREIAEELGLPVSTSVAVATSGEAVPEVSARQVLHQPAEAADRRTAWRRRGNLTVVAVDAPLTSTGAADAREFLAALAPSATWGVVEATRKAQDIGAWTRALGGVHALALTDVEETADPAAVLELGIPVSRLGARPATPRVWATLLTGRLAA